MKVSFTTLLLFFLFLFSSNIIQGQCTIPNSDFESVTTQIIESTNGNDTINLPTDWIPFFSIFNSLFTDTLGVSSGNPGSQSDSALYIAANGNAMLSAWDAATIFPCDTKPTQLQLDIRYEGTSADTLEVLLFMNRYDAANDSTILVGGVISNVVLAPGDSYSRGTVNITDLDANSDIDTILISFTVNPDATDNDGEGYYIDNLVFPNLTSGTDDFISANEVLLYPNPTVNQLTLDYGDHQTELIQIFNANGQLVMEENSKTSKTQLQVSHLPKGLYVIRSRMEEGWSVSRFVKQ